MKHLILLTCFVIIGSDITVADEIYDPVEQKIEIRCNFERDTMRPEIRYMLNRRLKSCHRDEVCMYDAYQLAGLSHDCAVREVVGS